MDGIGKLQLLMSNAKSVDAAKDRMTYEAVYENFMEQL